MKNINMKKVVAGVAALGVSALLAGSVVAANVGADNFSMNITKDTMYNNGVPSVSVVVGSMAQPVDVVWAGNIAAAIGKKAYTTAGTVGGAALQDVTIEVGSSSTSTVSGDGYLSDKDMALQMSKGTVEKNLSIINTDYSVLYDDDVYGNITGNSNFTVRQTETLDVNLDTFFSKNNKVKDLMTFIEREDITYTLAFGDPIPFDSTLDEYFTIGDTLPVKFMGGSYELQSATFGSTPKVTLVGSGSKTVKRTGDIISIGNYTLEVGSVTSSTPTRVLLTLKDNGAEVASGLFKVNDEVTFSGFTLDDVIKVVSVDQIDNNPDFVELSIGSDGLLELEHNKVLPGYGTSSDSQWKVMIDANTTTKTLSGITVYNDKKVWNVEDLDHDRAGATIDESIELPLDLGSVDFMGLTTENLYEFKVGNNEISWVDDRAREYTIPMYETSIAGVQKFGFNDYYFDDSNTSELKVYKGTSDTGVEVDSGYADGDTLILDLEKNYNVEYTVVDNGNTFDLAIMEQGTAIQIGKVSNAKWNFEYSELDNNTSTNSQNGGDKNFFAYRDGNVTSSGKAVGVFSVLDGDNNPFSVAIDLYTQDLARKTDFTSGTGISNVYASQADYNNDTWTLDQDHADDLRFGYTLYGSYAEVDGSEFMVHIPEFKRYLQVFIGGGAESSTTLNGGELVLTTPGTVVETEDGMISAKLITSTVTGGEEMTAMTPANWNVNNSRLVYLDNETMTSAGAKIIVGGHLVNALANGITDEYLTEAGQYVVGAVENGNIVVAGFSAADTAEAAKALITVIENMAD